MRARTASISVATLLLVAAIATLVYMRGKAPPLVARLLPESDAIVYVDLAPVRAAIHFDKQPVTRSPSYQQFIDATGIVAERDIDAAAFALTRMPDPNGPNGPVAFSEVFSGRFDEARLARYLAALAAGPGGAQEAYAGRLVYSFPSEGRTLRIAVLSRQLVAVSNAPTPEQIHSMLDRQRAASSLFASADPGSSVLSNLYPAVPPLSSAWAIGRLGLPFSSNQSGRMALEVSGLVIPLAADTPFVASLRYSGALRLRLDQIADSEAEAKRSAEALNNLLNLLRNLQLTQASSGPSQQSAAVRQFTDSIVIEQHGTRATLTASVPTQLVKLLSGTQP